MRICICCTYCVTLVFFFNDTATTEIYTLSLHTLFRSADGIASHLHFEVRPANKPTNPYPHLQRAKRLLFAVPVDRKSTRLNSSHANISYAVFCLKKKT